MFPISHFDRMASSCKIVSFGIQHVYDFVVLLHSVNKFGTLFSMDLGQHLCMFHSWYALIAWLSSAIYRKRFLDFQTCSVSYKQSTYALVTTYFTTTNLLCLSVVFNQIDQCIRNRRDHSSSKRAVCLYKPSSKSGSPMSILQKITYLLNVSSNVIINSFV